MDDYRFFRREDQEKRGGGVALYVREGLEYMELSNGNEWIGYL